MKSIVALAVVSLVVAAGSDSRVYAQSDSRIGTWKVNVAKSKYDPGPAPKSETRIYKAYGNGGVSVTMEQVAADGKSSTRSYSMNFDGKDYAYTGNPDADMIAGKRVDAMSVETTQKRAGKVVTTSRGVVSKDGKTLTVTTTGTNARGQKMNNVVVLDKQ
jgi:hypothetical protein